MKVILTKDVAKVGRRHEVKELADGFARNFIIARGWGIIADAKNLAKLKTQQGQEGVEKKIQQELLQKLSGEIGEKVVTLTAKANEQGHLFASLHASDISSALHEQYRLEIPESMIKLTEPIKAIGDYRVAMGTTETILMVRVLPS